MKGRNLRVTSYIMVVSIVLVSVVLLFGLEKDFELKDVSASPNRGTTLYVGGSGSNNYTKIQDAIDNASEGDTVYVKERTYYENLIINKTINLIGENQQTTIIDGNNLGNGLEIHEPNVTVSGFRIKNCNKDDYSGIKIFSSKNQIFNCTILDNYNGITIWYEYDNITIYNCNITSNYISGIFICNSDNCIISSCNIYSNTNYGIIICEYSSNNKFIGCNISYNWRGIYFYSSANNNIIYNNYFNNTYNAYDYGYNIWNISKTSGLNFVGNSYLGGNYWSDYNGEDLDDDGLGDTNTPYNCKGNIINGGDELPLVLPLPLEWIYVFYESFQIPGPVHISFHIADYIEIYSIGIFITYPDGSNNQFPIYDFGPYYSYTMMLYPIGTYNFYIWAQDINNKIYKSDIFRIYVGYCAKDDPDTVLLGDYPSDIIHYNNISFEWIGESETTQTNDLQYSYKLEGYDMLWSNWTYNNSVRYYNLFDGNYAFEVKAIDKHGNIDPNPAETSFTINKVKNIYNPDKDIYYTTIQDAIDSAEKRNKIFVSNGIYYENLFINKSIDLIGEDKQNTIIDGGEKGNVVAIWEDQTWVDGFTIKNGGLFAGLQIYTSYNKISNCVFINNTDGIVCANHFISNINDVSNCVISTNYYGINIKYSTGNKILNCNISNNVEGIKIYKGYDNEFFDCRILDNHNGSSIELASNNKFFDCKIHFNNCYGIIVNTSDKNKILSCNILSNVNGIMLEHSKNNVIHNCNISNNNNGVQLINSSHNIFFVNNFLDNIKNINSNSSNSKNIWNSTEPISYMYNNSIFKTFMGNYWGVSSVNDENEDGIREYPQWIISEDTLDSYPLTCQKENYISVGQSYAPSIIINSPNEDTTIKIGEKVHIDVTTIEADEKISCICYYINNVLQESLSSLDIDVFSKSNNVSWIWNTADYSIGKHNITAKTWDDSGDIGFFNITIFLREPYPSTSSITEIMDETRSYTDAGKKLKVDFLYNIQIREKNFYFTAKISPGGDIFSKFHNNSGTFEGSLEFTAPTEGKNQDYNIIGQMSPTATPEYNSDTSPIKFKISVLQEVKGLLEIYFLNKTEFVGHPVEVFLYDTDWNNIRSHTVDLNGYVSFSNLSAQAYCIEVFHGDKILAIGNVFVTPGEKKIINLTRNLPRFSSVKMSPSNPKAGDTLFFDVSIENPADFPINVSVDFIIKEKNADDVPYHYNKSSIILKSKSIVNLSFEWKVNKSNTLNTYTLQSEIFPKIDSINYQSDRTQTFIISIPRHQPIWSYALLIFLSCLAISLTIVYIYKLKEFVKFDPKKLWVDLIGVGIIVSSIIAIILIWYYEYLKISWVEAITPITAIISTTFSAIMFYHRKGSKK